MRRRVAAGTFGITSPGVSGRIDTWAPCLGSAVSKAQTIANRLQRELTTESGDVTISIRPLGGEPVARVVVRRNVIETYSMAAR